MAWLKAEHRHVDYRDYLPENVYLETVMRRPAGVFTHDRHSGNSIWKYVFNLILLLYIAYALCAPSYQIGSGASAPFPRLPPNETTTLPLRRMFDWTMVQQFWHSVIRNIDVRTPYKTSGEWAMALQIGGLCRKVRTRLQDPLREN